MAENEQEYIFASIQKNFGSEYTSRSGFGEQRK
jgi:hypothetical protein